MDAKLARSAKARAVLQTSFYSHLLAGVQQVEPRWMHLALGNGEFASFKVDDFAAYERQTRRLLAAAIGGDPAAGVYPEPVEHCAICRWRELCADRRRNDDDLSLVAGMTTGQRRALKGAGISTRRGLAGLAELPQVDRVSPDVLERAQRQARLQVASEDDGVIRYELLDPERDGDGGLVPNRGLLALPEPADGDLFFDIEGARYCCEDGREFGLQYLFGVVDTAEADEAGLPRYTRIWACDRPGEKRAFEELIDFITERRARHPGLHVYHYNHYEPTSVDHLTELHGTRQEAVGALMGRFATREDEVDDLFRLGVFTDLYRVVRQELAGEPDALGGLVGGDVVGQVKKSVVRRFCFPPQEHKFSAGGTACDPATDKQWTVCDVDDACGTIDLKMGNAYPGPWPAALVEAGPPRTWEQRDRLRDLGDRVVREGARGADAATALLLRRPPDDGSDPAGSLRAEGETASAAAVRLATSLRRSYLPMQGPPGTGKTYTAAEQILELIAHGRTAGITGPSHAVICHLIDTVYEHARWRNAATPRIGQRADRDNPHRHEDAPGQHQTPRRKRPARWRG